MISEKSSEPEGFSSSCTFATGSVASSKSFNLSGHSLVIGKTKERMSWSTACKEGPISWMTKIVVIVITYIKIIIKIKHAHSKMRKTSTLILTVTLIKTYC